MWSIRFWKVLSNKRKNIFATFVVTFLPNGGLNHLIFLRLFLLLHEIFLDLYFRYFWYFNLVNSNSVSLEELLHNPSLMKTGSCLMIWGGCFDKVCKYNSSSFGILKGRYVPLLKLNDMSRKLTLWRLISICI